MKIGSEDKNLNLIFVFLFPNLTIVLSFEQLGQEYKNK